MRQIVTEAETPHDSRTMFRLRIDKNLIAEGLTAMQAHILLGEILARITLPKPEDGGQSYQATGIAETPVECPALPAQRIHNNHVKQARDAVGRAVKNTMRRVEPATLSKEVRRIVTFMTRP